MAENLSFFEAPSRTAAFDRIDYPGSRPMTACFPSADRDTTSIALLRSTWLRRHGIDMPKPSVFHFADRAYPLDPATDRPGGADGAAIALLTRDVDAVFVEGYPPSILTIEVGHPVHGRVKRVLRIPAGNRQALMMCGRESWSPEFYIAPDDGCHFSGGNPYRSENSIGPMNSPMHECHRLPR